MNDVDGILERRLKSRPVTNPVLRGLINLQVACAQFEEDISRTVGRDGLSTATTRSGFCPGAPTDTRAARSRGGSSIAARM